MAVEIEVVMERSVGRSEFLQVRHSPEPRHRPLSSPERQVAVLGAVVEMATDLLAVDIPDLFHSRAIGPEPVCDDCPWHTIPFHRLPEKAQGC